MCNNILEARKLFDDVLLRRDRAEKTRNALNVLSRFRFLFCLPCIIDRHMQKQDYDIIINDYMRVKNLFNRTEVPVFKTALYETEKRIMALQKMLHDNLQKMPISIEEQKRLIRYLINLDAPYEPAWDAIQSHVNYINLRFKECYDEHKSAEAVLAQELAKLKNSHSSSKFNKYNIQTQDTLNCIPENVLFIEDLCDILSQLFPNLWKLGHSYFTGELLHVKIEPGKQVAFKHVVLTIIETFCKMLRAAVIPHTLDKNVDKSTVGSWSVKDINIIALWLPNILRHVRSSYNILIKLDLPNEALNIVSDLILDLKIFCMSVLFKQATEQVRQLQKQEDWKIEFNGVTGLPLKYEQHLQNVVQLVKESVLISEQKEASLSESPVAQKELEKNVESLFLVFYDVLKNLTFQNENGEEEGCTAVVSQLIGTPVSAYRNYGSTKEVLLWEHKLLKVLANCQYMTNTVLNNIFELFNKSGIAMSRASIEKIMNKFSVLEKTVLETYLEQKSDPLVGTIEPSMYLGKFDWDCVNPVSLILDYNKNKNVKSHL
ncbi:exocyst complex component 2-like [Agrilus planipennis]|uniref:Exocyst complex component 2 n=1 Tax=Agrilus planipennis TaxID=224129 RepID=A0A7F5R557_AGRPL|nr:exocyst complex component 2-like [Agrilus planipennis]